MQQAATTAARVVAVLSPAYLASEHGEAEREVFQAKDPSASAACCFPSGWPRSTHPGCSRHESMWTWSAGMRPAPGRHCWPPPGRAASRPRSRSTPGPSSHRSASPRRPGSRVSCRRSGTSPSIPTRTSPAATKCKARDRWQVIERPVSGQAYLTGNKVSPGYIEVRRVCHGDGGRCRYEPSPTPPHLTRPRAGHGYRRRCTSSRRCAVGRCPRTPSHVVWRTASRIGPCRPRARVRVTSRHVGRRLARGPSPRCCERHTGAR